MNSPNSSVCARSEELSGKKHRRAKSAHVQDGPTKERLQQAEIWERISVVDIRGEYGFPVRVADTLSLMHRRGVIDAPMLLAGTWFRDNFQRCHLHVIRAASLERVAQSTSGDTFAAGVLGARRLVLGMLDTAGGIQSPGGSCLWHVVGCEIALADWAKGRNWSGRSIQPATASGILIGALGALVTQGWQSVRYGGRERQERRRDQAAAPG